MKTKKRSKILSLLLALSMLVGMLPLSVIPANAAEVPEITSGGTYVENPRWSSVDNRSGNRTGIASLKGLMEAPSENAMYIRLDSDLKYVGDPEPDLQIYVRGVKHLDLNGHDLIYGTDSPYGYSFIQVMKGAELHIYDSRGGGYVHYEGYLKDHETGKLRNVITVWGGKLFVNGGTFTAGRSKEMWGIWEHYEKYRNDTYTGNIRHQIVGNAIELCEGSECVINGGSFHGRGDDHGAVTATNSKLIINGGYFKGFGGASALQVGAQSNSDGTKKGSCAINAGEFDTHKIDREYYDSGKYDGRPDVFTYGKYGKAIDNKYWDWRQGQGVYYEPTIEIQYNPNAEVIVSGTGKEERQTATVTPKQGTFKLSNPGWDTYSPDIAFGGSEITRMVSIDSDSFTPYFKGQEKWLAQDYNDKTLYYTAAVWQIFDNDGNAVSNEQMFMGSGGFDTQPKSVDMRQFKAKNGKDRLQLTAGQSYILRCTLMEAWDGDPSPVAAISTAEYRFTASAFDRSYIKYNITDMKQKLDYPKFALEFTSKAYNSGITGTYSNPRYSYGYQDDSGWRPLVSSADDYIRVLMTDLPEGKQVVMGCFEVQDDTGMKHRFFDSRNVFVMPHIRCGYERNEGTPDYQLYDNNTIQVEPLDYMGNYPGIRLQAVTGEQLSTAGLTFRDVHWQRLNETTGVWEDIQSNTLGATPDTSTGTLRLPESRSGTYRAYVTYYGTWYSTSFTVEGKDYSSSQSVTVTLDHNSMEYHKDKSSTITITPNYGSGDWGTKWRPYFLIYKWNVPEKFYDRVKSLGSTEQLSDGGLLLPLNGTRPNSGDHEIYSNKVTSAIPPISESVVPGKYTFIPYVKIYNGDSTTIREFQEGSFTLNILRRMTGFDITAYGENITNCGGTSTEDAPKVVMREESNKMNLGYVCIPGDANEFAKGGEITWRSWNNDVATVTDEGVVTAHRPGTALIGMFYKYTFPTPTGSETTTIIRYIRVVVPIAEVEIADTNWDALVGTTYNQVKLNVTRVRSCNGEWQPAGNYVESKVTGLSRYGYVSFDKEPTDKIAYNDSCYVHFALTAKPGYQFPLKPSNLSGTEFIANDTTLKIARPGSDTADTAIKNGYSAINRNGYRWSPEDDAYGQDYQAHICGIYVSEAIPCIQDPNAVYLETVAIETAEPRDGDLRYSGKIPTDEAGWDALGRNMDMMNVRVLTMFGQKTADGGDLFGSSSLVFKLTEPLLGSGESYAPLAEGEYANSVYGTELFENVYCVDFIDGQFVLDREKLKNARYTYGTYGHKLEIYGGRTGADGKTYYFSPDVRVLVNGKEVQVVTPEGENGYGTNKLTIAYYYTINDPRPAIVNGTVSGLADPVTGAMPQTSDQLTVTGINTENQTNNKMYVSALIWFIDENGNNTLDEGEQCTPGNGLSQDGRFLGGKTYSAYLVLTIEPEDGRINYSAFTLNLAGVTNPISTSQARGVYTFPETEIVGYGVSGNVESFNSGTDEVTIQLIEQGQSEAAYETTATGGTQIGNKFTAPYTFYDIPSGTYTIKVIKNKHATREYTITVGAEAVTQDVKINLIGDVTGDGNINPMDHSRLYAHLNDIMPLTDEYALKCADVTGDGNVNPMDHSRLYAHLNDIMPLF